MTNKKKLLIVEDEIALLKALAEKFTKENFEVLQARNGQEGLEMALREHPDLILLDLLMPVMDGLTMMNLLKKDAWGKTAQVIILTNLNESSKVQDALKQGVYDYLVKTDWKLEDVVKKVREKIA